MLRWNDCDVVAVGVETEVRRAPPLALVPPGTNCVDAVSNEHNRIGHRAPQASGPGLGDPDSTKSPAFCTQRRPPRWIGAPYAPLFRTRPGTDGSAKP